MRLTTCLLCLFLTLALPLRARGAEALVLSTADPAPFSRPGGAGTNDHIVLEAFQRLGIRLRLERLTAERALKNVDQGTDDGVYARIAGMERQYPNMVMVPEPVCEFLFTAFTKDPALTVRRWEDLKPLNVGFINGWKIVEANVGGARSVQRTRDGEMLFAMLDFGRADVVVMELYSGLELIRSKGYQGMRALNPPLERRDMHLYLNKRHADLVPRLDAALREMKRDGTMERLTRARAVSAWRGGEQPPQTAP